MSRGSFDECALSRATLSAFIGSGWCGWGSVERCCEARSMS